LGWGNNFDDIDLVVKILAKAVTINLTKSFKPF
jgi:hypothetical protein